MRLIFKIAAISCIALAAFWSDFFCKHINAALLSYKDYVVIEDQGLDILCDTHTVQQNDYVYKLFRDSGEISQEDFGEFIQIFKRINPGLSDIDHIKSGERILIPLKKITPGSLMPHQKGFVSIPFTTISTLPELLKSCASKYIIQKGDTISGLLSRSFGKFGSKTHQAGSQLFQFLNPQVQSLNKLKIGQSVWLPTASVMTHPEFSSYFDDTGIILTTDNDSTLSQTSPQPPSPISQKPLSSLQLAAQLLEAKLLDKGTYFFPRRGNDDFELDLSRFPVLELSDHSRALLTPPPIASNYNLSESEFDSIKSFWKSVFRVSVNPSASVETIFEALFSARNHNSANSPVSFFDNGVEVTIRARWWIDPVSDSEKHLIPGKSLKIGFVPAIDMEAGNTLNLLEYLAKHGIILKSIAEKESLIQRKTKAAVLLPQIIPTAPPHVFVTELSNALNFKFTHSVPISFPYGGIQIPAVSNLVSTAEGRAILIDFGDLYGEAISAIEKSGLPIICITPQTSFHEVISKLLAAAQLTYAINPSFTGAKTADSPGVQISIPGILVSEKNIPKVLFSRALLDPILIRFLNEREIRIFQLDQ